MLKINKKTHLSVIVSLSLFLVPVQIMALPSGASVGSGSVTISTSQNTMVINASNKAIINYNSFNIGANELVKFIQPNSSAVVLNRVVQANPSAILGTLSANGKVFLVNPAGIYFGAGSVVNANSFLATTLNITDKDFLNGNYRFEQIKNIAPSYIVQKGSINVSPEGFVVLAAPLVSSEGAVLAKSGKVAIGATDNFYIHFDTGGLINYSYSKTSSAGSTIVLPAAVADNIIDNIINTGSASGAVKIIKNGDQVELVGAGNTAFVSSKINTDASDGKSAGSITVDAQKQTFVFDGAKFSSNADSTGNGGKILIYSNDLTYSDKGASYTANGGLMGGDGGFLEISAKKNVIFDGSKISLNAFDGKNGLFYIDPDDGITISDNTMSDGTDLKWSTGGSFTVDSNVIISTRKVGKDGLSSGNSGSITITASNITLQSGSELLSFADNGHTSGDITLNAVSSSGDRTLQAVSSININGATIKGGNINIKADASSENGFKIGDDLIDGYSLDFLDSSKDDTPPVANVGLSIANSKAIVNIGNGSYIEGSSVNIQSSASSTASVSVAAGGVGVGVGITSADAETVIENGAEIKSSGDINIKSNTVSDNSVEAYTEEAEDSEGEKINVNLAYADSGTVSKAVIENGASITAGNTLNVNAYTEKSMDVSADDGANENSVLGVSVAIGTSNTVTQASAGGSIKAENLNINAQTDNDVLKTYACAGAENPSVGDVVSNAQDSLSDKLQDWVSDKIPSFESEVPATEETKTKDGTTTSSPLGLSAVFTYSDHTSATTADIAANANVNINGDTDIDALNNYLTSDNGESGVKTVAMAAVPKSEDNTKTYSAAGAVAVTNLDNTVNAYIDDGATLNSGGNTVVLANTEMPYQISWDKVKDVSDISDKVNSAMDITKTSFFTTWAQSSAAGDTVGMAGSVNYFHMKNDTEAYLGENTQINQGQSDYGTLSLNALTDIETMNLAGVVGLGDSSGNGLGGSYLDIQYDDTTKAEISNSSNILTKHLSVKANTDTKNISVAASGGKAQQYGISGSVSYLKINNVTNANINNADLVITGDSSTDGINLLSNDSSKLFNITGGVIISSSVGIGASVAINEITRDTEANLVGTEFSNAGITNINSVNSGEIDAVSLAGAVATTLGAQEEQDSKAGKYGIGLSGSVSLNRINDTTAALIKGSNNGIDKNNVHDIFLAAENTSNIKSFAGAVSAVTAIKASAGLAGAYSQNDLNNKTSATVDSSTLYVRNISLDTSSSGTIDSYTASCSGSIALGFSVAIAGSVSINNISNDITSDIANGSDVEADGNIKLSASDTSTINTKAGGIALSGAGIGAAFSKNSIDNNIYSYIDNSKILSDSLSISSAESATINALSASLDVGSEEMAGSAAIVVNCITNSIHSYIDNNSKTVSTNGDIDISANDGSTIDTQAGQASASGGGVTVGLSALYNTIGNDIAAYINNTVIHSGGNIAVSSNSDKTITAIAAGGSVSGSFSVAGAIAINTIEDNIEAYVSNSGNIFSNGTVSVLAYGANKIFGFGGMLSLGGTMGLGGSVLTNIVENKIDSYITDSSVTALGNSQAEVFKSDGSQNTENTNGLDVMAYGHEYISSNTANLGASGSGAVAASISVNIIKDKINSYLTDDQINSDNTNANAAQSVKTRAVSSSEISVLGGGLAGSGTAGIGVAIDTSIINNTTNAYIQNSGVNAENSVQTLSKGYENFYSVVISGALSGVLSVSGSVEIINVDNQNNAYITDSRVNSKGNMDILADDSTYLGTTKDGKKVGVIAGSGNIGGEAGVGGSLVVSDIQQNTNAFTGDSVLNVSKTLSINAGNLANLLVYAASESGAGFVGAGGAVCINTVNSKSQAYTSATSSGKMLINQDGSYKTPYQDVNIKSKNDDSIDSTPGAISVGSIAGVGGSIDVNTIHSSSLAEVGENSKVSAQGNLEVSSEEDKYIKSTVAAGGGGIAAVAGAVSIANINTNIDDKSLNASSHNDKKKKITTQGSTDDVITSSKTLTKNLSGDSSLDKEINIKNVDDAFSTQAPQESNYARIGAGSVIDTGGSVDIETVDKTNVDLFTGMGSLGLASLGGSVSIANIGTDARAYIDAGAVLNSGSINVDSNVKIKDCKVKSAAASYGAISLGAAVSYLNIKYENDAYVDSGSNIAAAGNININAVSDLTNNSVLGDGTTIGAGGAVGAVYVSLYQKGKTQAADYSDLHTAGNINIDASYDSSGSSSKSLAAAAGIGILNVDGSVSEITDSPEVMALVGDGAVLKSADLTLTSSASSSFSSEADGYNGGSALSVGMSKADASWNPTVISEIGSNTDIETGNLYMYAYENANEKGLLTDNSVQATALSATGALCGGTGSSSTASRNSNVKIIIGDSNKISVLNGDMNLNAEAFGKTDASSNGDAYGALAAGFTGSNTYNTANIGIELGSTNSITVSKNISFEAYGRAEASSNSNGGAGGLLSGGGTEAVANIDENKIYVNIGEESSIQSQNGDISIKAHGRTDGSAASNIETASLISKNESESTATVKQDISVNIDKNVFLKANHINISAYGDYYNGSSESTSITVAAHSVSKAYANLMATSETNVNIAEGSSLNAPEGIDVQSSQDNSEFFTKAVAHGKCTGVSGSIYATAYNNVNAISDATVSSGSKFITTKLNMETYAPLQNKQSYVLDADAEAHTVVKWVLTKVDELVDVAENIPLIGWVVKKVWKTVEKYVKKVYNSDTSSVTGGNFNTQAVLNMNGDIYQDTSLPQILNISRDGTVTSAGDITAQITGDNIVVNDLINHDTGSISLKSDDSVAGHSNIYLDNKYPEVTINNYTDKNLKINNINTVSDNAGQPNIEINYGLGTNTFSFDMNPESKEHSLNINNYGSGDVILNGTLSNYAGNTNIYNQYGSVYAVKGSLLLAQNVNIDAEKGYIGNSQNPVEIELQKAQTNPSLSTYSFYDTFMGVKAGELTDTELYRDYVLDGINLNNIKAGGKIGLTLKEGEEYYRGYENVFTKQSDGTYVKQQKYVSKEIPVMSKYYIGSMEAAGNININAENGVSLVLKGDIKSGITDQTVNINPVIDPYGENARYIASSDDDTVYLKNITQPGGNIDLTLNGGKFEGSGNVDYVNGYTHVTVNNHTDKNINLQEINTNSLSDSGFYINGIKQQSSGGITVKGLGYESGSVVINSNNGGEIQLNGNIENQSGTAEINGNRGVYNLGTNLIDSKDIILNLTDGSPIGTQINPVYTNGVVNALSDSEIYLFAPTLLSVDSIVGKDVYLSSNGDIDGLDNSKADIAAENLALQAAGNIHSALNNALNVSADVIAAKSNGDMLIHNSKNTVIGNVGTIGGLYALGNIVFGTDGTFTQDKGSDIISDNGNIALNSAGNMNIDYIKSVKKVSLESQNGAITQDGDEDTDIAADELLMKAANGIGDDGVNEKYIDTDVNYLDAYNSVANNIDIKNDKSLTAADLDRDGYALYNKNGNIHVVSEGMFTQHEGTKITGKDVSIDAENDILLSYIESHNAYITSLNGNIMVNEKNKYNIVSKKDIKLNAINGVIATHANPLNISAGGAVSVTAYNADNFMSAYIHSRALPSNSFINLDLVVFNNRVISGTLINIYDSTLYSVFEKMYHNVKIQTPEEKKENIINGEI